MSRPDADPPELADALPDRAEIAALTAEVALLRAELEVLTRHRFVRIHNSAFQLMAFQFFRGLALGLGTVVGATILVSVLAYLLAQIDFIPILGDWAAQIAQEIQQERN